MRTLNDLNYIATTLHYKANKITINFGKYHRTFEIKTNRLGDYIHYGGVNWYLTNNKGIWCY